MSLVLLGGGGHASDVLCVAEALIDRGALAGPVVVADDSWERPDRFDGRKVELVTGLDAAVGRGPVVIAVGYPAGRRAIHGRVAELGATSAEPLVHPSVDRGANVELGPAGVVMGQTWLSANVGIGANTHVGYGTTIGHDTVLGEFCAVMPGACIGGDITIEPDVMIGANATVLPGLTIGRGARIGAGAVVTAGVAPGETVVGVPARPLDR